MMNIDGFKQTQHLFYTLKAMVQNGKVLFKQVVE